MIDRFFGAEAKDRIEAAVRQAETGTLGQIVPVVVERSGGYASARLRGALLGILLAGIAGLLVDRWFPLHPAELVLGQIALAALGLLAGRWGPLERRLAGAAHLDLAVRLHALRAFHEHDLHHTAGGTGVLVFASLFERRAVIMGDHGIDARMGDEGWRDAVALLTSGMRRGDPAAGFCDAITRVGAVLARHFPRGPGGGPENELPDRLRVDRG